MKTLVIYYSYTGSTKKEAMERASAEGTDVFEITDRKRPGTVKAYVAGSFHAMKGSPTPINPITVDMGVYRKIIIMAPVWAGYPAPPINHVLTMLPRGAEVEMVMVSASGSSSARQRITKLVEDKGCRLIGYQDVKSR